MNYEQKHSPSNVTTPSHSGEGLGRGALLLATLSFFTRLPFWKLCDIPAECYKRVVPLWPFVGWVTGGIMALVYLTASFIFPPMIAALLALTSRLLITGALHEDGFADFCDGFGGGTTRERILEIMKDSHIGTYGVLGLMFYALLISTTMSELLHDNGCNTMLFIIFNAWIIISIDIWSKYCASRIIYDLPYARKAEEAKNKLVYADTSCREKLLSLFHGALPFIPAIIVAMFATNGWVLAIGITAMMLTPLIVSFLMFRYICKRIQGYTGDCCGAVFIISELSAYLACLGVSTVFNS